MTSQTQQFIELSRTFELRAANAGIPNAALCSCCLKRGTQRSVEKCPKCKTAWSGYEHASSHEPDIQRFVDSLKYISQLKLGCTLMLEIKNTLGPGASRQQP